ncbi:TolC family protein [Chryseobacterium terrae]|uniref:TolC family protein n=1 Tax=Chryseobacterium terrae TaxID=3163299 RepID=A0ABW8Y1P1_9FLAO
MKRKWSQFLLLVLGLTMTYNKTLAQKRIEKILTINELFWLVKENHPSLKPYESDINIAKQNTEVAKNQTLPEITTGLQAYYLGDSYVIDKDFSNSTRIKMPHFGNRFSLDARQLIWKGNAVKNSIKIQTLREELAELNYQTNEQNIRLLVLSYYLDLYKLINQEGVYLKNIELAEKRLQNINSYFEQGMVTRNDVIRGELQISNLQLELQVIQNNQQILNKQLCVALGLGDNVIIRPDKTIFDNLVQAENIDYYQALSNEHPTVRLTQKAVDIYDVSAKITKSEMLPSISAFAGNSLQRPLVSSNPPLDMYSNGWSAGLALNFNIDALFKTPKKLQVNKFEKERAANQAYEASQMIEIAVNSAFIKYNEALSQNKTLKVNTDLTSENYRIMESKYNNQLAILLDLIDASNAKLDAELQYSNSEINIVYNYYKLLKEAGNL